MGTFADRQIALATRMIKSKGRSSPVTFIRSVKQDYAPTLLEPLETPPAETYTCYGAPINFLLKEIDKNHSNNVSQVTTLVSQKMLYIPGIDVDGQSVIPKVGDMVGLESNYRIQEVIPYETESVVCAYLLKIGV
jgi:hypothetical protein